MEYKGYKVFNIATKEAQDFYAGVENPFGNLLENEYVVIEDDNGKVVDCFRYRDEVLDRVFYPEIRSNSIGLIKPLDSAQHCAMDLLFQRDTPVKVITGVYGSGKDHLMWNTARTLVEDRGEFKKIVFVRPNVTLKNVPDIGFLPGDIDEKLGWILAPIYDKVGGQEGIQQLIELDMLEIVPLLFIRGRSFENCIIYVTEAQNIDSSIAKVLLSRVGAGSEIWLNGDYHDQTDRVVFDKDNGLKLMIERLSGHPLFGQVYLPNTHRSEIANLSNLLD